MQNSLFRKTALNKLASPEQLDRLMQITTLPGWLALLALGGLVAAAVVWSVAGRIPLTMQAQGILQPDQSAVIFIPLDEAQALRPGQVVEVVPVTVQQQQYGFMQARVRSVSSRTATNSQMAATLGDPELLERLVPDGLVVMVELELLTDPDTPSGFQWSLAEGPATAPQAGTPINARVILKEERPIDWVFGS